MYYYYLTTKTETVNSYTEDEEGYIVTTSEEKTYQVKTIISKEEMIELFYDGVTCYISYDNEPNNELEDSVIELIYVNSIEEEVAEEQLVGASAPSSGTAVPKFVYGSTTITVSSVSGNNYGTVTSTPTMNGYTLKGIVGISVTDSNVLIPYCFYVDSGTITVKLRNVASTTVENRTVVVYTLWEVN